MVRGDSVPGSYSSVLTVVIPFFPMPYPGEIFFSTCARYSDRARLDYTGSTRLRSPRVLSRVLFGTADRKLAVDLPTNLDHLIMALPPSHLLTAAQIIDKHTLYPYYQPFLVPQRRPQIVAAMHGNTARASMRSGRKSRTKLFPQGLRYCPICIEQDKAAWGEPYWHRVHQAIGVYVCPLHPFFLENSSVPYSRITSAFDGWVSASRAVSHATAGHPVDENNHVHNILMRIARDVTWLIDVNPIVDPTLLQRQYMNRLLELDMATQGGVARMQHVFRRFEEYYPQTFLADISCVVDPQNNSNWLFSLSRPASIHVAHPLHHLLFIQFLGYTLEEFVSFPIEQRPFGNGPWPCLNRGADHWCRGSTCSWDGVARSRPGSTSRSTSARRGASPSAARST